MSSYIVEDLQKKERESPSTTFIFYFCNDRIDARRTTLVITRGLLVQLLRRQPVLFEALKSDYSKWASACRRRHARTVHSRIVRGWWETELMLPSPSRALGHSKQLWPLATLS